MNPSFQELGLSEERVQQLETLGFTEPTNIQAQAIPHLLSGRDVVGQSQTGTGKTAAFSLPILERLDVNHRAVQALVLAPTRELAIQVHDAVSTFIGNSGLRVAAIYGGQSIERQIMQLRRGVHIVVGTPGRVIDLLERGCLKLDYVRWFVLDEADEMLSMGFIDDVEKILSQAPTERQTALFSATMPPSIRQLVNNFLNDPVTVTVQQPKAAPNKINQVALLLCREPMCAQVMLHKSTAGRCSWGRRCQRFRHGGGWDGRIDARRPASLIDTTSLLRLSSLFFYYLSIS